MLDLEDENKTLTLTDEQYKTWLEIDIFHINTKRFFILFNITEKNKQNFEAIETTIYHLFK
jgi:hypothetical protein